MLLYYYEFRYAHFTTEHFNAYTAFNLYCWYGFRTLVQKQVRRGHHAKAGLEEVTMQKHINDKSTMELVRNILALAEDIRIATYPTDCDALTKEIIGEECDLGNYMEWAGPELENETKKLHILLSDTQH